MYVVVASWDHAWLPCGRPGFDPRCQRRVIHIRETHRSMRTINPRNLNKNWFLIIWRFSRKIFTRNFFNLWSQQIMNIHQMFCLSILSLMKAFLYIENFIGVDIQVWIFEITFLTPSFCLFLKGSLHFSCSTEFLHISAEVTNLFVS